jgi:hypothetical protein
VWQSAVRWCRRWRWVEPLLAPAVRREIRKGDMRPFKEYQAIRPLLDRFLTLP